MSKNRNYNIKVNTPTVLQMEAVECGAASLAMILGYYKKFIPLEKLRIECGVSRDGSKANNVLKAARKFGMTAKGYRKDIDELADAVYPAIIFWNFNHFVVLEGIKKDKVYLNDPAEGKRILSWEDFDIGYTGIILEFTPNESFEKEGKKSSIIPMIKKRLHDAEDVVFYLITIGLFLLIPGIIIPTFSRFFIDEILIGNMKSLFKPMIIAMILTALFQYILSWLQKLYLLKFNMKLSLSSSSKFLYHLFHMPMEFFSQRIPGEIATRVQLNNSVASLLSGKLPVTAIEIVSIFFYAVLMFRYDILLTIICIASVLINILILKAVSEKRKTGSLKVQQETGILQGTTMSGISIIETLKSSGTENDFFMQWAGQQAKVVKEQQKLIIINQITSQLPNFLEQLLKICVLSIGALRVMEGDLTLGMLIAFQSLMANFTAPVQSLMDIAGTLQTGQAEMQRLDDVMAYPQTSVFKNPEDNNSNEIALKPGTKLEGYIELKDVSFGYSLLEPPLLDHFNLSLKPGSRIALVGSSGSGKSTAAKLITTLFQSWNGEILYDGYQTSQFEKKVFADSVAIVNQDCYLFEGTIKDNLTMWDNTISEEDYIQAAKDACIHEIIAARPGGYLSEVEEGGMNFSGGQRQRLEIARALAGNPRVLIMDEATSALDTITEKTVDENIRRRGCTCIIVAHRLSTIRDSDEIIVLSKGKIIQKGTHEELISQGGEYSNLIKSM
ncbi:MAG: NHLP family bacteriocin export ABC transporter peptidase/permease/ATPase subunit [Bacteroides sp.]|nr:NHLP family bacteriocin export ABC transporter peptidase/permease/ATPase subunit [Prevotella sp.]MCM1407248.1 NHLP family bacteriocin export ABC transporter peptidase/permease/ATPase subunit [Treponema brennaborense]MCM1469736.1 NHLP family bacteriocin export ABC transporter peptidase/permease/ATPase subunit [Bacteroides sp.]